MAAAPIPVDLRLPAIRSLSDDELLQRLSHVLARSRRVEADVVAHIAEVDERRLFAREAMPSMFAYCTEVLHLSEPEAYLRITVARASREHPLLLPMLADGRLHLSGIAKLVPHLTVANRDEVLARAAHKSKREIEGLVAELAPRPDAPAAIRWTRVTPLSPARYLVQFMAGAEFRDKLDRLKALMPGRDLAAVVEAAVTEKLERVEARRFGKTKRPRPAARPTDRGRGSRHVPAAERRAADERDERRCAYVDDRGRRCQARQWLELDHVRAWGRGGGHAGNIRLLCHPHNRLMAEREYGKEWMARFYGRKRRKGGGTSAAPPAAHPP